MDPSNFNFFLKIHSHPKGLFSGGKSINSQVWFCIIKSISLLIASFQYSSSGETLLYWMSSNHFLPCRLKNMTKRNRCSNPFTTPWFFIVWNASCNFISSFYSNLHFSYLWMERNLQKMMYFSILLLCLHVRLEL